MTDLFSLAKQMAENIPEEEKKRMQGMRMDEMVGTISENVMKMMQSGNLGLQLPSDQKSEEETKKKPSNIDFCDIPTESENVPNRFMEDIEFSEDDDDVISQKTNDVHYNLNVKLEDLYNGKQKKISFKRKRYKKSKDDKGKEIYETFVEKKKIIINIVPGMRDGQTICFHGEADQLPGHQAGDVIITICEDEHDTFDRDGDNLFLIKDISLSELYSMSYTFTHMDKRKLTLCSKENDSLHTKDGIRKIVGEGMPIYGENGNSGKYGDLFIRFNLIIPDSITESNIEELKKIAPPLNSSEDDVPSKELEEVTEEDIEKMENDDYDSDSSSSDDEDSSSVDENVTSDDEDLVEESDNEEEEGN